MHVEIRVSSGRQSAYKEVVNLVKQALEESYGKPVVLQETLGPGEGNVFICAVSAEWKEPATKAYEALRAEEAAARSDDAQAFTSAVGFSIDPLESAIGATAQLIADERDRLQRAGLTDGQLIESLGAHLEELLRLQRSKLA